MEQNWVVAAKRADFRAIAETFGIDPVTARLIRNRGPETEEEIRTYLYGSTKDLHDPLLMKDVRKASLLLQEAIRKRERIRVIGDYDIDGVCASCILERGLRKLGADVDVRIPDRIRDGYGLNPALVEAAVRDGIGLLLTCDNGIAAESAIAEASGSGMKMIITDHHEVPFTEENGEKRWLLPPADAVVDPKQEDCGYPFRELCGAAVAWKLLQALYALCGLPEEEIFDFLEIVAIATVGDVMELCGENRILVREGLEQLRHTQRPGLLELIRQNDLEPEQIDVYHIGFILGPCLNAGGRLDTAFRALQLLETEDRAEAAAAAADLIALNARRKELTVRGTEAAERVVESSEIRNDRVLVVYLPECHESLTGIIAGRLRERYGKPVFVLTDAKTGVKGSGRSIEPYSMFRELQSCRDVLIQFGGHPMAAGLSLTAENVGVFRERINAVCTLSEEDMRPKITIDVPMPISYIRKDLIREFDRLRPFGKGNPKPLFAEKGMKVLSARILGKNRNVLKMRVADPGGLVLDAVYFGDAGTFARYAEEHETVDLVYYPVIDIWQGVEKVQINVQAYR